MLLRSRLGRLVMWMGLAAAAMYFLDPERGSKRRKELRKTLAGYRKTAESSELGKTITG